ncbi:MAG: tautomerase family protein [Sulfuricella sp.]
MPYLTFKLCPPPSPETAEQLTLALTELTAGILKKKPELTAISVEHIPSSLCFIGGKSLASQDAATFHLDIKVTEGTNTKDEKAAYIKAVFSMLESLLGRLHPTSYIVVHEVRADAWGYGGATQEFRYIEGKVL